MLDNVYLIQYHYYDDYKIVAAFKYRTDAETYMAVINEFSGNNYTLIEMPLRIGLTLGES